MLVVVDDNFHLDRLIDRLERPLHHVTVLRVLRVVQVEQLTVASTLGLEVEADITGVGIDAPSQLATAAIAEGRGLDREYLVRIATHGRDGLRIEAVELEMDGGVGDVQDDVVHIVNIHPIEAHVHTSVR